MEKEDLVQQTGSLSDGLVRSPELWCVHVMGPDDLYATASRSEARNRAHEMNAFFNKIITDHEYEPNMWAVPALWPYDAASHTEDLERQRSNGERKPEEPCTADSLNQPSK
jgi:hypothetical protein